MHTFKDDYYRSLCDNPTEYDKVVDWITANNPAAKSNQWGYTPEEFAANAVHACIRNVLYGTTPPGNTVGNMWCSTGMCVAYRSSWDKNRPGYKKVCLAVKL